MANVTVPSSWWTDPRRLLLNRRLGGQEIADGCMLGAFVLCSQLNEGLSHNLFKFAVGSQDLLDLGLARIVDDRFVRVSYDAGGLNG